MATNDKCIAAERVFAIPELLENILLRIFPTDRYPMQRVNKTFRATIAGSKRLLRGMHLDHTDYNSMLPLIDYDFRFITAIQPFAIYTPQMSREKWNWVQPLRRSAGEGQVHLGIMLDGDYISNDDFGDREHPVHRAYVNNIASKDKVDSWRKIRIGSPGQRVMIEYKAGGELDRYFDLQGPQLLGDILCTCAEEVKQYWADKRWDEKNDYSPSLHIQGLLNRHAS